MRRQRTLRRRRGVATTSRKLSAFSRVTGVRVRDPVRRRRGGSTMVGVYREGPRTGVNAGCAYRTGQSTGGTPGQVGLEGRSGPTTAFTRSSSSLSGARRPAGRRGRRCPLEQVDEEERLGVGARAVAGLKPNTLQRSWPQPASVRVELARWTSHRSSMSGSSSTAIGSRRSPRPG